MYSNDFPLMWDFCVDKGFDVFTWTTPPALSVCQGKEFVVLCPISHCSGELLYCKCAVLIPIQLTASGDCSVRLWDVGGGVMLDEFKAHSGSVKSIDVKMDEPSQSCTLLTECVN